MQRYSETIGALAGALAKAQAELSNPAKVADGDYTGRHSRARRIARFATPLYPPVWTSFVNAWANMKSLSSRPRASRRRPGLIRLTTMLAHSSGEWMSSDWPVCPLAEMGAPHRMGAALTYARRYALFTLVGIAGEDDLDAPDLPTPVLKGGNAAPLSDGQSHRGNGQTGLSVKSPAAVHSEQQRGKAHGHSAKPVLAAKASAARREELLTEIAALTSIDQIDTWALHGLPAKNALQTADAQLIEDAFGKSSPNWSPFLSVGAKILALKLPCNPSRCRKAPL